MRLNKILLSCILLISVVGWKNHKSPEPTPPAKEFVTQSEPVAAVAAEPEQPEVRAFFKIQCATGNWITDEEVSLEDGCVKFTVNGKQVYACGNFSIEEK